MKNINIKYLMILSFALTLQLIGCSENVYEGEFKPSLNKYYFGISSRDFEFGNGQETKNGNISSENATWSFSNVPSWLSMTPQNGNSSSDFAVSSLENEAPTNRTATFFVEATATGWSKKNTIVASQTGTKPYITFPNLESTTLEISSTQQEIRIQVAANIGDLKVNFSENWAHVSYDETAKVIIFLAQQNESDSYRTGKLTINEDNYNVNRSLNITQHASNISILNGGSLSFDADGGTITKTIESDLPWTAKTTDSWIEISPKESFSGNTDMKIDALPSYEADKRTGYIYFYFGDKERCYISVTQTGRYIRLSKEEITLSAEEATQAKFGIESNIEWKVYSLPEWLHIDHQNGTAGNSEITLTASKNSFLNSRSGTLVIADAKNGSIQARLTVTQNGIDFIDTPTLEFNWHQSSQDFVDIPFTKEWNATVSEDWISLSDYSGTGNRTLTVSVSKNETEDPRSGEIILTSEGKNFVINVVQNGQYLKIDNTSGEFTAIGGTLSLSVATTVNTIYKVEYSSSPENWITVNKLSDQDYSLTIYNNPSSLDRNASFKLIPTDQDVSEHYSQGIIVMIKQSGRTISCDVSEIYLTSDAGESSTYTIKADGEYTISKDLDDTWYTITHSKTNNTFYITYIENLMYQVRKGKITVSLDGLPIGESQNIDIIVSQSGINLDQEWIDLGLPSGLKWATCNLGASSPEESGDYYAWGETSTKSDYSTSNSLTYNQTESALKSKLIINFKGNLDLNYDAAYANWGENWRMPTKEEYQELVEKCTWVWTTLNGKKGYKVTGPNKKSIFLPVTGFRRGKSLLLYPDDHGYYWASSMYGKSLNDSFCTFFNNNETGFNYTHNRSDGCAVRPVKE